MRHAVRALVFTVLCLGIAERATSPVLWADGDADFDGLDDGLEYQLAPQFFPDAHRALGEDCATPSPLRVLFRARHLSYDGVTDTQYVGINYVVLYDDDCGVPSHEGDNEPFMVILEHNGSGWQFSSVSARAHWGAFGDASTVSQSNELWISANKHANYVEFDRCVESPTPDDCSEYGSAPSVALYNVGEPSAHLINDLSVVYEDWAFEFVWLGFQFRDAGYINEQLYTDGFLQGTPAGSGPVRRRVR